VLAAIRVAHARGRGFYRPKKLGAGRHTVEIRYRHWPLKLFWVFYGLYGFALLAAVVTLLRRNDPLTHQSSGTTSGK